MLQKWQNYWILFTLFLPFYFTYIHSILITHISFFNTDHVSVNLTLFKPFIKNASSSTSHKKNTWLCNSEILAIFFLAIFHLSPDFNRNFYEYVIFMFLRGCEIYFTFRSSDLTTTLTHVLRNNFYPYLIFIFMLLHRLHVT